MNTKETILIPECGQLFLLEQLNKIKISKNSNCYHLCKSLIGGNTVYPIHSASRQYVDNTKNIIHVMKELDIKLKEDNDAPRGGKTGNTLTIEKIINAGYHRTITINDILN